MLYFILFFVGIVVNSMIFYILLSCNNLRVGEYFIFNLVVMDLFMCVVSILFDLVECFVGEFLFGLIMCYVVYLL